MGVTRHDKNARRASRRTAKPSTNPLRRMMTVGKMPVLLELHLTEADRLGYVRLRRRYLARGAELPRLSLLGHYIRELDLESAELATDERALAHKLQVYADLLGSGRVDLVALDDGARGRDSLDNAIAAELLIGLGADPARLMANVVARNRQADQIRNRLTHFANLGLRCALLLTGDLPIETGKSACFPLDSIGMCDLARRMMIEGTLPGDFIIAAAGHPNPDVDPDGLGALHKALAGARLLVTQAIYSLDLFQSWMDALRRVGVLDVATVLAEMIPLTSSAQLRTIATVPGMRIPGALIEELSAVEQRIDSTARRGGHDDGWIKQQRSREAARVTRGLLHRIRRVPGVSGFYLGCVKSFDPHLELLQETPLLPEQGHGTHKARKLTGTERQRALAMRPAINALIGRAIDRARSKRNGIVPRTMRRAGPSGVVARALRVLEWPKTSLFGCTHCDRCDLSPDALICPRGCAKQMTHGPCGAPRTVDGRVLCEDTSRDCTWATIRSRRNALGIDAATRLGVRPPPSPGFYRGERFSSFWPVLTGDHPGPDWRLAYRAPWAAALRLIGHDFALSVSETPPDLLTLVAAKAHDLAWMLDAEPNMDREALLVKVLGLIGTPQAVHLIETRMCELGVPAEGALADLSIRELFHLAETIPIVRDQRASQPGAGARYGRQVLLEALPGGAELRRAMRREMANELICHITAMGVPVTYADVLLEERNVDDFLAALTLLKSELQLSKGMFSDTAAPLETRFDRVHYKQHYRAPVAIRAAYDRDGSVPARVHLAIDVRQFGSPDCFQLALRAALERLAHGYAESDGEIVLEPFGGESRSVCWAFNAVFWERLADFERATGISYDESIGGSTDHNLAYVRSTARALYDRLHNRRIDGDPLYVLEIGVAAVHRARAFMDELKRLCELMGTSYYNRITYLLADFSQDILDRGRKALAAHHRNVESVLIDAGDPASALAAYAGRIVHAHLCNVYDNLPTDKVALVDGRLHRVESRAYLLREALDEIAARRNLSEAERTRMERRLRNVAREREAGVLALLDDLRDGCTARGEEPLAYVAIWMDLVAALRFEQRLMPVATDRDLPSAGVLGLPNAVDQLQRLLAPLGNVQVHLSEQAIRGFRALLGVLHEAGALEVVDLFVQRGEEYLDRHKGPAKYDGTTVNWLNGPLFRAVAEELGYRVRFHSFKPFDPKSASVTMLASPAGSL